MPISFSEVNSMPDILSNGRFTVFFPSLPNGGGDGKPLSLSNTEITLPAYETAQIIVKIMGWSIAFAGRRIQNNTLSMSFLETVEGNVHPALVNWQIAAAGTLNAGGMRKNDYSIEAMISVYDTTGRVSLNFIANNVWPMRVTPTTLSDDGSQPARVEVDFSVDSVDLDGVGDDLSGTYYSVDSLAAPSSGPNNRYPQQRSLQAMPFDLPLPPEVRMSAATSLKLMNSFMAMPISGTLKQGRNAFSGFGVALGQRV